MNWVTEETNRQWRAKAIESAEKHKKFEKSKKITHTPHPTSVRCEILNYTK